MDFGSMPKDKHRANTKVEDTETNLLLEGQRYRHLEYSMFLTPDPLEYVDGYNFYAYCGYNPWGRWDPHGLFFEFDGDRAFREDMEKLLENTSKLSETAKKNIEQLRKSGNPHVFRQIKKGEKAKSVPHNSGGAKDRNVGSGTTIYIDPSNNYVYRNKEGEILEFTPEEIVAHETDHSADTDKGKRDIRTRDYERKQLRTETKAMIPEGEVSEKLNRSNRYYWDLDKEIKRRKGEENPQVQEKEKKERPKPPPSADFRKKHTKL